MICSLAKLASVDRTELLYLACFAPRYFRVLLALLCFGWFASTALGSPAREACFARTDYARFA